MAKLMIDEKLSNSIESVDQQISKVQHLHFSSIFMVIIYEEKTVKTSGKSAQFFAFPLLAGEAGKKIIVMEQ